MRTMVICIIAVMLYAGCDVRSKRPTNGIVREKGVNKVANEPEYPLDIEFEYKNGEMVRYTQLFQNGQKKLEILYSDPSLNQWGSEEFETKEYFESGKKKLSSHTIADSIITKTEYFENGQIALDFNRTPGRIDKGIRYFADGKKKEEFEYQNEQRHGVWCEWDSLGRQTRDEKYLQGTLVK